MGSIVVGRQQAETSDGALRFGCFEAQLRGCPVALTHVWDVRVEIAVDLPADADIGVPVTASAVPGPVGAALLAQHPELLVLGKGGSGTNHLSPVLRAVLHHASFPVVVVPPDHDARVERVIVGVSQARASMEAAKWAATEAALHHADLVVVQAWQLDPRCWRELARPARAVARRQPAAEIRLERWARRVLPAADLSVLARHGGPLDVLLAESAGSDLIVVGYSPHQGLDRVLHGHLADDLTVLAPCPVAVVPAPAPHRRTSEPLGT